MSNRGRVMKKMAELTGAIFKDKEDTVEVLLNQVEEQMGTVPMIFEEMSKRPEIFIPNVLRDFFILRSPKAIDLKTAELIAVASAASLKSEGCLKMHIGAALKAGSTMDEVFDVIMISSLMAQTSRLSSAFKIYKEFEENRDIE
ncbi:MAG: carboxymuconolactone decarboxylase family protein [Halobacteriota archaeon]|nr:carboxymuconolactone decarboxylase family protein [Halobacteriota archaeon]